MKKHLSVLFLLATATAALAVNLNVSPSSMAWTNQQFVNFNLSGISTGAQVELSAFIDIDGDGILDATDPLAVRFELEDGFTNAFGATTFVDDNDGAANGAIASAISFYGHNYLKSIGHYIWQAVELDGSGNPVATNTTTFAVTQPTASTWITGEVRNYLTDDLIEGAYVELAYFSDTTGTPPSTWSDENGQFTFQLPDGVPANEVLGAYAFTLGEMSIAQHPDTGEFISAGVFTNALAVGANPLPQPLYTVPAISQYGLVDITGTVYLIDGGETNALAGAFVEIEYPDFGYEDGDAENVGSADISADDGSFSLVFPLSEGDNVNLTCADGYLTLRGIVAAYKSVVVPGATNINLYCHRAKALISGTVTNKDSGDPIVGLEIDAQKWNDQIGTAFTISNGLYEIGLPEGTVDVQADEGSLADQHYVSNWDSGYRYIENLTSGEVRDGQDLAYAQGFLISGHVYTEGGVPLPGGNTLLIRPSEWEWEERVCDTTVALDGHYNLLAAPGTWHVRTENSEGAWMDHYYKTNGMSGTQFDTIPIVVSNANVSGIDFYLQEGARLQGTVLLPDSWPAGDFRINVFRINESGEPEVAGTGSTDWDGYFSFVSSAESNLYLRVDSDGWQTPETWLGNVGSRTLSSPIHPALGTTTSNLNIQVLAGYQVQVSIQDQISGATPDPTAFALDAASNRYGSVIEQWGSWNIFVPTNTPLTFYAEAPGYAGEFITNTYSFADADYLQLAENNYIHLTFYLHATTRDSDGDGLPDYMEDTIPDGNPGPGDFSDPILVDTDGDGADDYQEYWAGTDAQDANSIFQILEASPAGGNLALRWSSVPGREYTVQIRPALTAGSWSNLYTVVATGAETSYAPPAAATHDYYRVVTEP